VIGEDRRGIGRYLPPGYPVLRADLRPRGDRGRWHGRRVVAFAGIGRPQKFFDTLGDLGANLAATHGFADHQRYEPSVIDRLAEEARRLDAKLVTTAKDAVRLAPEQRELVEVLAVDLVWRDPGAIAELLARLVAR